MGVVIQAMKEREDAKRIQEVGQHGHEIMNYVGERNPGMFLLELHGS